jgi:hypothetical protein
MLKKIVLTVSLSFVAMPLFAQDKGPKETKPKEAKTKEAKTKVEVAGVKIIHKSYGDGFNGLRPLNDSVGTKVALFIKTPGNALNFLPKKSTIHAFADDKGNSLMKDKSFFQGFGSWPKVSKDGKVVLITLQGSKAPTAGTKNIIVKADLVIVSGSKTKLIKSEKTKIAKDVVVKVGDYEYKLTQFGKPNWGKEPFHVVLQSHKNSPEIASVTFLTADGKAVKTKPNGKSISSGGGSITINETFNLGQKLEECIVQLKVYTDMKVHTIPVDMKIGLAPAAADKK